MKSGRKLHIGGEIPSEGWEILNVVPGANVDHVCDAANLSIFDDNTFAVIYASHVLEHFDYVEEISNVLVEWKRVLTSGGLVCVSAPDLETLAGLFVDKDRIGLEDRYQIMRMIFGGQMDKFDFHKVGLYEELLGHFLFQAGFKNIQRVERFDFFDDASLITYQDVPLSLNMRAEKSDTTGADSVA